MSQLHSEPLGIGDRLQLGIDFRCIVRCFSQIVGDYFVNDVEVHRRSFLVDDPRTCGRRAGGTEPIPGVVPGVVGRGQIKLGSS